MSTSATTESLPTPMSLIIPLAIPSITLKYLNISTAKNIATTTHANFGISGFLKKWKNLLEAYSSSYKVLKYFIIYKTSIFCIIYETNKQLIE